VYKDAELSGTHGEGVEVELTDGRVGSEEVVASEGAARDHHSVAREHKAGLRHA
jgi:hypothetical protein